MLRNISNEAGEAGGLKLLTSLDNIISSTGTSARTSVKGTVIGELAATSGSAAGALAAEAYDPSSTGSRLMGELIGGNLLYATIANHCLVL
jgi:hypothetical protein